MDFLFILAGLAWVGLFLLPWRPWSTRERLDAEEPVSPRQPARSRSASAAAPAVAVTSGDESGSAYALEPQDFTTGALGAWPTELSDLADITVLIPARDEAGGIARTLRALAAQGANLQVILIDDQSGDNTAAVARAAFGDSLRVLTGQPLPEGWTGKLWALEQGWREVSTPLVLLLDADIELAPGMVVALRRKLDRERLDLVSLMAALRMETFWERLLAPAFIYFFKLLYPFALGNSPRYRMGVAAGGCVLVRADMLRRVGAFASLRGALIDDCTLARQVKAAGGRTWIGLTHSVRSHRAYQGLAGWWSMVARSAFMQLRYSVALLLATTAALLFAFWLPSLGLALGSSRARVACGVGWLAMMLSYWPTLRFYGRSPGWALALPIIGTLYLGMTWTSAIRYWRGRGAAWKGRTYGRSSVIQSR